jgi:hypothetical protein
VMSSFLKAEVASRWRELAAGLLARLHPVRRNIREQTSGFQRLAPRPGELSEWWPSSSATCDNSPGRGFGWPRDCIARVRLGRCKGRAGRGQLVEGRQRGGRPAQRLLGGQMDVRGSVRGKTLQVRVTLNRGSQSRRADAS